MRTLYPDSGSAQSQGSAQVGRQRGAYASRLRDEAPEAEATGGQLQGERARARSSRNSTARRALN
jgi:hypothetical protein